MCTIAQSLLFCALATAAAVALAEPAFAATDVSCSPFIPHTRIVGDLAHDIHCTDATIQAAIDNACPNATIFLTVENIANDTYVAQHLSITGKTLSIVGTQATSCSGVGSTGAAPAVVPTAPLVTISGNGAQSVFDIGNNGSVGSDVTLQYLEITGGGGDSNSHGGGIDFNGIGSLTLDTTTIDLNHAGYGGGIELNGNGGSVTLTLKAYSLIESNSALVNGGGINIEGHAHLLAVEPFTMIGFNHAPNGKGGGVAVIDPATADIGSPGYGGLPVINGNDAALGGGLAAQGNTAGQGFINLFTTDPLNPVVLSGNFASAAGGGVYLLPSSDASLTGVPITLCAADFRIDGNSAPDGSAVYADHATDAIRGVAVYFNIRACGSPFLSHACSAAVACNTLNGNNARDGDNHPLPGSVVVAYYTDVNFLQLDRFAMRDNTGAHAIRTISAEPIIHHCLIAQNTFGGEMLRLENDGNAGVASILNCTIAGNSHNSGSVIHAEHVIYLDDSILDQPVMSSMSFGGTPAISASHILAADPTGLPVQNDIVQGEPIFAGALNGDAGDFHLAAFVQSGNVTASLGIDFAPPLQATDEDLDGEPYDQNVPGVGDAQNTRDLGCYEAQPVTDRVFTEAFGDPVSILK